ncbi:Transposon TX1 uncharacterized 149 kDa protein ORF 2 [Takifugu flavidus]|uniref:Transposon TX1 uncharacterized 149 kDa protein ORF 2 n=1 Tax=Takifugu flavidus TaxID=433684 RepID=A0A5C6PAQ7_9TELE|nr:Transposon TX1 uncharacterized 149 kDa protein ORF 2 [Takifugu flavidus]
MVCSQKDVDVLVNLTVLFNRLSAAKVNWQKSESLAIGSWTNGLPVLPQNLAWWKDGLKFLGVFIGDEVTVKKNGLDTVERVEGRIGKGKWLLPCMSYRGRTLVLNNLVASVLWHRLNCLEPPSGEEGGQGLIHLASRTTTFRIQFVQRFLTGPVDLMWQDVARQPKMWCNWRNRLRARERHLLVDYGWRTEPDGDEPFLEIKLVAHLGDLDGPLLRVTKAFFLHTVDKKTLYQNCVKVLNRRGLSNRSASMWTDRLGGDGARPCWRVLYKLPVSKRSGDLQWRILHGASALNVLSLG